MVPIIVLAIQEFNSFNAVRFYYHVSYLQIMSHGPWSYCKDRMANNYVSKIEQWSISLESPLLYLSALCTVSKHNTTRCNFSRMKINPFTVEFWKTLLGVMSSMHLPNIISAMGSDCAGWRVLITIALLLIMSWIKSQIHLPLIND